MRQLLLALLILVSVASCAPQAAFFRVQVKDEMGYDLNLGDKQVAVFSLSRNNGPDSTRSANAALGLASKLQQDREMDISLPVFSVSALDFAGFNDPKGVDKEYLKQLMLETGADLQIFVHSLQFGNYSIKGIADHIADYTANTISLPFMAAMTIYDAMEDSLIHSARMVDTVYLNVLAPGNGTSYDALVALKLEDVSRVVGENMAAHLTPQWNLEERMLVNYPGNDMWEIPLGKANEFKWDEAIALWMPSTRSENARIASFAAYNIAVACEMLEKYDLALEWAEFSVKRFSFKENEELRAYLNKKETN